MAMKPDLTGLRNMRATAIEIQEAIEVHRETSLSDNDLYHLEEAEGNLGQFIEELDKTLGAIK